MLKAILNLRFVWLHKLKEGIRAKKRTHAQFCNWEICEVFIEVGIDYRVKFIFSKEKQKRSSNIQKIHIIRDYSLLRLRSTGKQTFAI